MLNLIELLPEKDKELLDIFLQHYSEAGKYYCGNEIFLKEWNKNKQTLYKLLGGFTKSIPFKCEKDNDIIIKELSRLVLDNYFCYITLHNLLMDSEDITGGYDLEESLGISYRILEKCLAKNLPIPNTIKFKAPNANKMLQISKGCAPVKAVGKIINYLCDNFPSIEGKYYPDIRKQYEEFRQLHSQVLNDKELKGDLVLSILPLDYLTMSNNSLGWTSCMQWCRNDKSDNSGCYHAGTIEMMNSNNVVCCYLSSKVPYVFHEDKETGKTYEWNNKKWRMLAIVTPEIICSGKAYPYQNKPLLEASLGKLKELAEKNCKWKYQYGLEEYQDMKHISGSSSMWNIRYQARNHFSKYHKIVFDTTAMYNDYLNDKYTKFYCYRNYVKHNILMRYSGKAICTCCGEHYIENNCNLDYYEEYDEDEEDYNSRYEDLTGSDICFNCTDVIPRCECCGKMDNAPEITMLKDIDGSKICYNCLQTEFKVCHECNKIYNTGSLGYSVPGFKEKKPSYSLYIISDKYDIEVFNENKKIPEWTISRFANKVFVCEECAKEIVNTGKYGKTIRIDTSYINKENDYYCLDKTMLKDKEWVEKYTNSQDASREQIDALVKEYADN